MKKSTVWKYFAEYICLSRSEKGICTCVTCAKKIPWNSKKIQAGHFIPGRFYSVLFCESIVFPQCDTCNIKYNGERIKYRKYLLSIGYTDQEIEQLENQKYKIVKFSKPELQEIADFYREENKKLKKEMGIK